MRSVIAERVSPFCGLLYFTRERTQETREVLGSVSREIHLVHLSSSQLFADSEKRMVHTTRPQF